MSVALQVERCEMDYSIVSVLYLCITECQERVNSSSYYLYFLTSCSVITVSKFKIGCHYTCHVPREL